jgi:2-oxoglutarate ferredoxin oxidoreductase subunit alpha
VEKRFEVESAGEDNHILINSNDAIAMGALAGGVSFFSGYPMTPATSIMTFLSRKQNDAKILVEQVEDEISAINMAMGASYAGARAMTASSGGGVALMVETFSLQGITEIPMVVVDSQRPGPATGLPTRTEQGDLEFVLYGGHGEFPRMVIGVRDAKDAFYQTARALNLADKYQLLVIILTDEYLTDTTQTIPPFDFNKVSIERHIASREDIDDEVYRRYKDVQSGISPRIIPGKIPGWTVLIDSDEHNEYGHITESAEVRKAMVEKRSRKFEGLKAEIHEPAFFGTENPEILLIGWGSTYGPLKEAVEMLQKEGICVGALVFGDIWPLPTKLLEKYTAIAKKVVNVEQNFSGQLAKLIRQTTGIPMYKSILKFDGRQLGGHEIYARVKSEVL